jgi:molybdate transport system ATP-binding protein
MAVKISVEHRRGFLTLNIAFETPSSGINVLFGPSGAGTSFMLAAIAGLQSAKHVQVELDGDALHTVPAHRRRVGLVFPEGRLFDHLSVEQNLLFGLQRAPRKNVRAGPERRRTSRGGGDKKHKPLRPGDVAELLGLQKLLNRRPATLNVSERQRVAIGRALLAQPRLLLMDDPLAALDAAQRAETLHYLQRLRGTVPIPVLYATHSLEETYQLANFVVLLEGGQVLGAGPLTELASRVDLPLAERPDASAVLLGHLHSHAPARGLSSIECGSHIIDVTLCDFAEDTPVRLLVPAREVMLALHPPRDIGANNVISGMVCAVRHDVTTHAALVEIETSCGQLLAHMASDAAQRLHLQPGDRVHVMIKSLSAMVISG